mmetsp:Transcript_8730/g.9715  ORF Transcript_8730/g.9715 Transcript_8730/m.9715 type:complete len:226 (+) Transcript_8730:50-727(+)
MGVTHNGRHKRRVTGSKRPIIRRKRKFEAGRAAAMTKIGARRVTAVRTRGGSVKFRALRLDNGSFSWGTEAVTRKCKINKVVYNATSTELVRTNTLVKGCILEIDATPFKKWYFKHYYQDFDGKELSERQPWDEPKGKADASNQASKEKKKDGKPRRPNFAIPADARVARRTRRPLEDTTKELIGKGILYARVSSRPGQSGFVGGYILEGDELQFYTKKMTKRRR